MASKDLLRTREKNPLHPRTICCEKTPRFYVVVIMSGGWESLAADRTSGKPLVLWIRELSATRCTQG